MTAGRVVLLVLLIALGHAQAAHASISIFARLAFLSLDNPGTQQLDELASQPAPYADTAGEALAEARVAVTAAGVVALPAARALPNAARSFGITRAPPSA